MPIAKMEEVRSRLAPYHDTLSQIVHEAWAEWRSIEAYRQAKDFGAVAYKRTISNFMFDAIARRASRIFAAHDGIHVRAESQTVKFFAGGDVLFRFKKGAAMKLGCNIPTQAVLAFIDASSVVPGLPPETAKVEIIWQPNEIWTEIERLLVVARDGGRLIWEYDLSAAAGGATIIPFPTPVAPDSDEDDQPLVRPKPIPKPETGEDKK